jgi:cobyrinic acid a,c-diamide synthase
MSEQAKLYSVIEDAVKRPLIPYEPSRQSLKQWTMFVLRDKGFKVVYAQNADFAIERGGEKLYFKVSETDHELDGKFGWVVWNSATKTLSIIPQKIDSKA